MLQLQLFLSTHWLPRSCLGDLDSWSTAACAVPVLPKLSRSTKAGWQALLLLASHGDGVECLPSGTDASGGRTLDADIVGSTVCGIRVTEVLPESGLRAEKVLVEGVGLLTARPVCLPLPGAPALVRGKDQGHRADVDCCRLVATAEPILVAGAVNWEVSVLARTIVSRLRLLQLGSACAVDGKGITASAPITWRCPTAHLNIYAH